VIEFQRSVPVAIIDDGELRPPVATPTTRADDETIDGFSGA